MFACFDYYMPGFDYKNATRRQIIMKWAHLTHIRQQESKTKKFRFITDSGDE